jgi:mRNA-degrading endonuclease RelE of RelBE toxin-antitoxin system
MIYTVLWRPLAEQQLARLWTNAADRQKVASAADTIDSWLRFDPQSKGESRSGRTRILFVPPLVVLFQISEEDRTVYVTAVGKSRRE